MRYVSFIILLAFSLSSYATKPGLPDMSAVDLFTGARTAITQSDPETAILYLNTLLNMPNNEYTQEAQELIGMAREDARQTDKAKAEYEYYLKMYPTGVNADRVRKRLEGLSTPPELTDKPKVKKFREIQQTVKNYSVSQYYYGGASQSSNGSRVDVSTIITNLQFTSVVHSDEYDTKLVIHDTQLHNMLSGSADKNNLTAFYIDQTNKAEDYSWRIGRQYGAGQGALGRFDGLIGRYRMNDDWRLTGIIGTPDEGSHNSTKTNRYFYGVGVELNNPNKHWSGNIYGVQQMADGLLERRAIGTEMRYFNEDTYWLGSIDYDTLYKQITMATLQGNFPINSYNVNLLFDHRNLTVFGAESAVNSVIGAVSVRDLRQRLSAGDIYSLVKTVVPQSDTAMISISTALGDYWKISGDVRATYIGATDGNNVIAPQPGIKDNYTFTTQLVGSDIIRIGDTVIMMSSFVTDPKYHAENYGMVYSIADDKWHWTGGMRYYQESQNNGMSSFSVNPSFRVQYQLEPHVSIESELNVNYTHSNSGEMWRELLFVGYRWDFK